MQMTMAIETDTEFQHGVDSGPASVQFYKINGVREQKSNERAL